MAETAKMPIMSHFSEMRRRFFRSVLAIIIATALSFIFYNQIFEFLLAPGPEDMQLQAIELMENLSAIFRVCLTAGFVIAMPFIVYQVFAFLAPALRPSEKRYVYTAIPFIGGLFISGVAFAYYVALPAALGFLLSFGSDIATPEIRISNYINIVTRLLVAVGISFEMPIIIMVLARVGIVTPEWLAGKRKIWLVVAFILGALITPTFDPINQTIIAIPLIVLYEVSIILARIVRRRKNVEAV
ncbi:MAG: twin-arginine translocase subunit TatC [Dehalococcoidales bacterium]